jgi:hypothetical protein
MILRYHRSSFFTFLFFMPKSCSAHHEEPSKTEFAIFRIFYEFLENLQESANVLYYRSYPFATGPLELFKFHRYTLKLHRTPRKGLGACKGS